MLSATPVLIGIREGILVQNAIIRNLARQTKKTWHMGKDVRYGESS
jgi:hypothetical protein